MASPAPSTRSIKLTKSLQYVSGQSNLVQALGDEVRAMFGAADLPKLKGNIHIMSQLLVAIEEASYQGHVASAPEAKDEIFNAVYTSLFGVIDARDKVYLGCTMDYLRESGAIQIRGRLRRMADCLLRAIFR